MPKLLVALAVSAALGAVALAHGASRTETGSGTSANGKTLYRKYCGQCHALSAAMAAGFGTQSGLGTDGGPNFNSLRVTYKLALLGLTLPFIGHETVAQKLTWNQMVTVSRYVAATTAHHHVLALETDG